MYGNDASGPVGCLTGPTWMNNALQGIGASAIASTLANDDQQDNQQTTKSQLQNICIEKSICLLDQLVIQLGGNAVYEHPSAPMLKTDIRIQRQVQGLKQNWQRNANFL